MAQPGENEEKQRKNGPSGRRAERLKAALRENLRRRKAQERARKRAPAAAEGSGPDPSERDKP